MLVQLTGAMLSKMQSLELSDFKLLTDVSHHDLGQPEVTPEQEPEEENKRKLSREHGWHADYAGKL